MDLSGFFKQNVIKPESIKCVVSERFLDKDKKPIEWEIMPITSQEDAELRKQAGVRTKLKHGQYLNEMDSVKYSSLLATACTVYPNLNDEKLQNSYNVMCAEDLLRTMLLPGEYSDYVAKIHEICGFDKDMDDLITEAKN